MFPDVRVWVTKFGNLDCVLGFVVHLRIDFGMVVVFEFICEVDSRER